MCNRFACVTLLYGDSPAFVQAMVLGESLLAHAGKYDRVLLHRNDVPPLQLELLSTYFNRIIPVHETQFHEGVLSPTLERRLSGVLDKLSAFALTEYEKVLLLDSDTLLLGAVDQLFEIEAPAALLYDDRYYSSFGEAPKAEEALKRFRIGIPYINAGVMVLKPDAMQFQHMLSLLQSDKFARANYRYPEEVFLTGYFAGQWHSISHRFNFRTDCLALRKKQSQTELLLATEDDDIQILHYVGGAKPYYFFFDTEALSDVPLYPVEQHLLSQLTGREWSGVHGQVEVNCAHKFATLYRKWEEELGRVRQRGANAGWSLEGTFDRKLNWVAEESRRKKLVALNDHSRSVASGVSRTVSQKAVPKIFPSTSQRVPSAPQGRATSPANAEEGNRWKVRASGNVKVFSRGQ